MNDKIEEKVSQYAEELETLKKIGEVDGYCVMALKRDEEIRIAGMSLKEDIDEEQLYWMFYVLMKVKPYGVTSALQAVDEIIDEMRREEEDGDEMLNTMKHFINKKK